MRIFDSIKRLSIAIGCVSCCLLIAWQIWPLTSSWWQQRIITQLTSEVATANDNQVNIPLRQMASLGTPAVPTLVAAAASNRTVVAEQARQIVDEMFTSWQYAAKHNQSFDIIPPATKLAAALALQIDRFGPRGKQWAEGLALRLIVVAEKIPPNQTPLMLEDCSRVLSAVPASGPRLRNADTTQLSTNQPLSQRSATANLPLSTFAVPSESVLNRPSPKYKNYSKNSQRQNQPTPPLNVNSIPPSDWSPDWGNNNPNESTAKPLARAPLQPKTTTPTRSHTKPKTIAPRIVDIPSPAAMQQQMKRLRQKSSSQLVRMLPQENLFEAGPIRAVLRERGLTDQEIILSKRYNSTQVEDRLKLIDDLSVLPAVTARRWLHWLLEDDSPEVRLRALSAIATTSDPRLYEVARDIAVHDQDPRVAKLASQIMEQAR